MEYPDEDVAFAFRLLNERESLDDKEVEEWMKTPAHRRLMNDMEGARQAWEARAPGDGTREEKSRRLTLRWSIVLVIIMLTLLVISRVARE
jgi:hypothetical protein